MLLSFVITLLAQAPSMHKTYDIKSRCEAAMSGFILLDLFKLVSELACRQRGLPRGALWIAPQTSENLQQVALSVIIQCASKPDVGDFHSAGHCRMTELPVEEWFSRLRCQSSNAQLDARAYWKAACREMLRASRLQDQEVPACRSLPPLNARQFDDCSARAMKASLELVSICSGIQVEALDKMYREWCESGTFNVDLAEYSQAFDFEEPDLLEPECGEEQNECVALLSQIHEEARFETEKVVKHPNLLEFDIRNIPDKESMASVIGARSSTSPLKPFNQIQEPDFDACAVPKTLHQCLYETPNGLADEVLWDRLWRLCMVLRHWQGGCDRHMQKSSVGTFMAPVTWIFYDFLGFFFCIFVF